MSYITSLNVMISAIKSRRYSDESSPQLADECQLVEACSLIDALPEWTIVGKVLSSWY